MVPSTTAQLVVVVVVVVVGVVVDINMEIIWSEFPLKLTKGGNLIWPKFSSKNKLAVSSKNALI